MNQTNTSKVMINDVHQLADESITDKILQWVKNNKSTDYICAVFDVKGYGVATLPIKSDNVYVAGSAALKSLLRVLNIQTGEKFVDWVSNDTDIFCLGQRLCDNLKLGSNLDVTNVSDETVEELITGFDIPVCRVALSLDGKMYVTAHALSAVFTGSMFVPKYMNNKALFMRLLANWSKDNNVHTTYYEMQEFMYDNFNTRAEKYLARGFRIKYFETDIILPFVMDRLEYVFRTNTQANHNNKGDNNTGDK